MPAPAMKRVKSTNNGKEKKDHEFPAFELVDEKSVNTMLRDIQKQLEANKQLMVENHKHVLDEIDSIGSVVDVLTKDKAVLSSQIEANAKAINACENNLKKELDLAKEKLNGWHKIATDLRDETTNQMLRLDKDMEILEKGLKRNSEKALDNTTLTSQFQMVNVMAGDITRIEERTGTMLTRMDELETRVLDRMSEQFRTSADSLRRMFQRMGDWLNVQFGYDE